jgi:hypothetical protein
MSSPTELAQNVVISAEYFDHMLELIPASYYFTMKGRVANQKYWSNLKELAPKLELKQKTKKAQKSALVGSDLSQKSIPELISAGFEEESSDDESGSTSMEDNEMEVDPEEMQMDSDEEEDGGSDSDEGSMNLDDLDDDEDSSDDEAGISFVPKGSIKGVNLGQRNDDLRQKLLERINSVRKARKAAPIDSEGNVLEDQKPHSKRKAALERRKGASSEPELSKRQQKNMKKRLRKEQALKSLSKSIPSSSSHTDGHNSDSDVDHKPPKKKAKVVEEDLDFGKVQFEDGHAKSHFEKTKEKRDSKEKTLAKLKREKAYEQKLQGTEEGERLKEDKAWSKTFQRMEGEKVKDRADLLQKTLKREEASKRKSQQEWKERKASVKTSQDERLKKRAANLRERTETIKLKKMGKKGSKKK